MRDFLKNCRRIAIKAGTSILTASGGRISEKNLERLGGQILKLRKQKKEIVLVSSGAIAYGMESVGFKKRPKEMPRLQACAAIGQGKLMYDYERFFSRHGVHTAQLLLTRDGLEDRVRFMAARHTLEELIAMKALPIVNENDTVATEEIAFGDNDILSVHVSHLMKADLLIILSDVDGFSLQDGSRVREVPSEHEIDHELVRHLRDSQTEKTVGGMRAKLKAARVAMGFDIPLLIVNGHDKNILRRALDGEDVGTMFRKV
jgi:glutamate 5-kinase